MPPITFRRISVATVLLAAASALAFGALALLNPGQQMTEAATAYIASLKEDQKKTAVMPYDSPKRLDWHFIPKNDRKGLQVKDMTEAQRRAAHTLLRAALSQVGYDKARTIMELETLLHSLQKGPNPARDPHRYFVTLFGEPAADSKWGLSFEGHHMSLNFVVENNQVVSHTPAFFGVNPQVVSMSAEAGPVKGTYVLEKEEVLAFELLHLLSDEQKKVVVIAAKAPSDIRTAASQQISDAEAKATDGIVASKLTGEQMHKLWAILHVYANNMPQAIADMRLKEIHEAGFEKVYFAWAGADKPGVGHYYRIQGPTFLIEYVNVQPDAAGNVANHSHAVWRDVRGDFGVKR
ncbi:MAG: DUF3500 domain-containing protein [Phycisphaeraceae bacterium]